MLQQVCDDSDSFEAHEDVKGLVTAFASDVLRRQARPFQVEAVSYLLDGRKDRDNKALVVIRPPGDGKSLCYIMAGCFFQWDHPDYPAYGCSWSRLIC